MNPATILRHWTRIVAGVIAIGLMIGIIQGVHKIITAREIRSLGGVVVTTPGFLWASLPEAPQTRLEKFEAEDWTLPFRDITGVDFHSAEFSADDLKLISGLPDLEFLYLDDTNITDAGLAELKNCSHLDGLSLGRTSISDEGLRHVAALPKLSGRSMDQDWFI